MHISLLGSELINQIVVRGEDQKYLMNMATFLLKKDSTGDYYWVLKSDKNNEVVARSSESYESKAGASNSIEWTKNNAKNASIKDLTN